MEAECAHALPRDDGHGGRSQGFGVGPAFEPLVGDHADEQLPVAIVGRLGAVGGRRVSLAPAQQNGFDLGDAHGLAPRELQE
ncbi:hypothetical protein [Devosia aurantiaca]|uniref:hypothetical protein n=1 Tax=Devosia aurantiaca TaxID=2714858 RepID=UPI001F3A582B|nr:hypothetical protein [Devosia aurantiaca]